MRGVCSIDSCEMRIDKHTWITKKVVPVPNKIHESFEGLEDINICWHCGDKILKAIEKELEATHYEPIPVELPAELKSPVVIDDLNRFTARGYWFKGKYYPIKKELK